MKPRQTFLTGDLKRVLLRVLERHGDPVLNSILTQYKYVFEYVLIILYQIGKGIGKCIKCVKRCLVLGQK